MEKNNDKNKTKQKRKLIFILLSLIVILIATNGWSFYFYAQNNGDKTISENNKYNLLNPARKLFNQEDLIANFQLLRNELNKIGEDKNISIYFEYLPTGANIAVNKDADFFPASLLKLPLVMSAIKKIEKGDWQWNNELVLMHTDKDERYGDLYQQPIGTRFTIEDLLKKSIIDSDNTAYLIILRNLEANEFDDMTKNLGLNEFFDKDGKISAKKYAVILRSLYNSSYLNEENSQKLLLWMKEAKFKEYLTVGLPGNIIFAHKFGISDEENVYLDTGIVYVPKRPYFLIAMIKNPDKKFAQAKMKEISEKTYNYVANYEMKTYNY